MAKPQTQMLYHVHNTVRRVHTRLQRAMSPERQRMNLLLGGGLLRIVRGRSVPITEQLLKKLLPELVAKEQAGLLQVTTSTGQLVDLATLQPVGPVPVSAPLPHPQLDSAADDNKYPIGQGLPNVDGGKAASEELERPGVLDTAIPEGEEEPEEAPEEEPAEEPAVSEDLEAVAQALYDGFSKKQLETEAPKYSVDDFSGNKMDLVRRLVEAGMRLPK